MAPSDVVRIACALAGATVIAAAWRFGLRDPLASMTGFTAALMALNQLAPPLLVAALPPGPPALHRWTLDLALDPVLAFAAFVALSIAVSVPAVLDPTLADALYAGPLGLLELATGLAVWAQLAPTTRRIRSNWRLALCAWAAGLPMGAVAVVWMLSPRVLYTPYLDVICRWDLPPLLDQRWAGLVMLAASVPLQLAATWVLLDIGRHAGRHAAPL